MAGTARNQGIGRRALARMWLLLAFVLAALAGPAALASEVVDVRVGAHPGFTRIVFELDTSSGWRLERTSPGPGLSEVVVSIDASSIPRELQSSKGLVSSVRITPQGDKAVAYVRVTKEGLRLKQMILADPPRLVLDVLAPAIAEKPEPKKPAPTPTRAAEKATPAPTPKAPPPPAPKATPPPPAPKPTPAVAKPVVPAPAPVVAQNDEPAIDEEESDELVAGARPGSPTPPSASAPTPSPPPPSPLAARPPSGAVAPPPAAPPSGAPMRPGASASRSLPLASVPEEKGMGMGTLGGLLALLALVAVVVLVVLRRRAGAAASDSTAFEGAGGEGDENPFAGLGYADDAQPPLGATSRKAEAARDEEESPFAGLDEVTVQPVEEGRAAAPAPRTAAMELGGQGMDAQVIGGGAGASSGSATGAAEVAGDLAESEEVTRMLREFERRIASLETRLDEVVDARERLERQVAAQTEELRVQRAAIARTQRAVRNLTRGDEDVATEPAPRDPDRPRTGE